MFLGLDLGSSMTKAIIIDQSANILGRAIEQSETDFVKAGEKVLERVLRKARLGREDIVRSVATGYGRKTAAFAQATITEITCTAKGSFHLFPVESTIIDIGGQDTKIIKLDGTGRRIGFKMNRKCAAGTGSFLEEISGKMGMSVFDLDDLAQRATEKVRLNSFCTVFSSTEILERVTRGETKENMIRGAMDSVVRRVLEMDSLLGDLVLVGGVVAHNKTVVEILEEQTNANVHVPEDPQTVGALGAALIARKQYAAETGISDSQTQNL